MKSKKEESNKDFKRESYLKIARELCYPKIVRDKIKKASSEFEVLAIMKGARLGNYSKNRSS